MNNGWPHDPLAAAVWTLSVAAHQHAEGDTDTSFQLQNRVLDRAAYNFH